MFKPILSIACFLLVVNFSFSQWTEITPPGMSSAQGDLDFLDVNRGLVASSNGVYWTQDGGLSWQSQDTCAPGRLVDFTDAGDMLVLGSGGLCRSTDNGQTWNSLPVPFSGATFGHQLDFLTVDLGMLMYCQGTGPCELALTINGGASWTTSVLPFELSPGCTSLGFFREKSMLVDANQILAVSDDSVFYQSLDAGLNWDTISSGPSAWRFARKGDSTIYLGNKVYSTDLGQTWLPVPGAFPSATCAMGLDWGMFSPTEYLRGTASGPTPSTYFGEVELTSDGGATWVPLQGWPSFGAPDQLHWMDFQTIYGQQIYSGVNPDVHTIWKWNGPLLAAAPPGELSWELCPVPAREQVFLRPPNHVESWQMEVFDLKGQMVSQKTISGSRGEVQVLDVSGWPRGLYLCRMVAGTSVSSRRLLLE